MSHPEKCKITLFNMKMDFNYLFISRKFRTGQLVMHDYSELRIKTDIIE